MNEKELVTDKQNSVKFSINAKGLWSGELKVYSETGEDAFLLASELAERMEDLLLKKNSDL
jgi:hypothetical protein